MEKFRPMPIEPGVPAHDAKKSEDIVVKERFDPHSHETVFVVEDAEYRERLAELRSFSNEVNKALQLKLDQAGLRPYYSWNKSSEAGSKNGVPYPKIMRLALLLRPEHFKSAEEKMKKPVSRPEMIRFRFFCMYRRIIIFK